MRSSEIEELRPLMPPEVLEARRGKFGIFHGVLDVLVAEIGLQGTGVVPFVR